MSRGQGLSQKELGWTATHGNELADARRHAGLGEDLVSEVVGVGGHRGRLPDDDVANEGGRADKVAADGGL